MCDSNQLLTTNNVKTGQVFLTSRLLKVLVDRLSQCVHMQSIVNSIKSDIIEPLISFLRIALIYAANQLGLMGNLINSEEKIKVPDRSKVSTI